MERDQKYLDSKKSDGKSTSKPIMSFDLSVRPSLLWASIALVSLYVVRVIKRRTTHKLPPGPMGLPFIGSLLSLSTTPWKEFEIWKDQYGAPT